MTNTLSYPPVPLLRSLDRVLRLSPPGLLRSAGRAAPGSLACLAHA